MDIVPRHQWGAQPANHQVRTVPHRQRQGVELHHSVGLYGASTGHEFMRSMQADHLGRDGWADVWYGLAIWIDGTIFEGRGTTARSAPTDLLTVCLAGNYDTRALSDAQITAIQDIRRWLKAEGGGTRLGWHGQRAQVGCPGRHVIGWARNAPPVVLQAQPEPAPDPEPETSWLEDIMAAGQKELADIADALQRDATARRALAAVEVARHAALVRQQYGLDANPHSDGIWGDRVASGSRTLADVGSELRDAAEDG